MSVPPEVRALASAVHEAAAHLNLAMRLASEAGYKLNIEVERPAEAPFPYVYTTALKDDHFSWLEKRP